MTEILHQYVNLVFQPHILAFLLVAASAVLFDKYLDKILNKITMYRVVLYYLIFLVVVAMVLGTLGILPYSALQIGYTSLILLLVSWVANTVLAWAFEAPANSESIYITALILTLIITPIKSFDLHYVGFLGWAAVWSQAGKYMFAIKNKHVFNPAALAVAITAVTLNYSATWWVGTSAMLPFVAVGILIVRKIRRTDLASAFFYTALATIIIFSALKGSAVTTTISKALTDSPLVFFTFIMITEPLTTPPTRWLRVWYGMLVGFLFAPQVHIGSFYFTPELALLMGNIFSYAVSPKGKLLLTLKAKVSLTPDTWELSFTPNRPLKFYPGQYLEWTLPNIQSDLRGNRRYFTIASAPEEQEIRMGVKFYNPSSTFKTQLFQLKPGEKIVAGQLAGDFTLPKDKQEKIVFLAGGIGVTPFRSMVAHLLKQKDKRDIVLLYSARSPKDLAYKELFDKAAKDFGLKTVYTVTDNVPSNWQGRTGFLNRSIIEQEVPDFKDRIFYVSGPQGLVDTFSTVLSDLGVHNSRIKKDFFPGFV